MRWLCNENIPRILVEELRQRGHDVAWVQEVSPGITDIDVLALAVHQSRVCLTFDKDFWQLAAGASIPADCGVLLPRTPIHPTRESVTKIAVAIDSRDDWVGHFSVMEPGRIRMRPLAGA